MAQPDVRRQPVSRRLLLRGLDGLARVCRRDRHRQQPDPRHLAPLYRKHARTTTNERTRTHTDARSLLHAHRSHRLHYYIVDATAASTARTVVGALDTSQAMSDHCPTPTQVFTRTTRQLYRVVCGRRRAPPAAGAALCDERFHGAGGLTLALGGPCALSALYTVVVVLRAHRIQVTLGENQGVLL